MKKIIMILLLVGILIVGGCSQLNKTTLSEEICVYDSEKYLTCGKDYTLVSEGDEYNLKANEPFYLPQGENKLISLIEPLRVAQLEGKTSEEILMDRDNREGVFLLFLEGGEHEINEETSRRAVGSLLAK